MKIKKILASSWLIWVFLVVVLLRLPSLFEPFTYGDEGIYLTLGLAIRKGLTLYRDIHDNKPPILYLLAALAGNFTYYRALFFLWSLVTIYVFFRLVEKIFSKNQKAVILSTFAFAILTSIHTFEGNIGNAENFMLLPTLLGILLLTPLLLDKRGLHSPRIAIEPQSLLGLRADLRGSFNFFLAGVMFSLAVLFKIPAAFDFLAIFTFLVFICLQNKKKNLLSNAKHQALLIIYYLLSILMGFLLPILITLIYYAAKGALNQYLNAAFLQNIPYLTSWGTGSHSGFNLFRSGLFVRGVLLFFSYYLLFTVAGKKSTLYYPLSTISGKISRNFLFVGLWFFSSLFAALLSSRPYPHYLIQALPPLSLLVAFILASKVDLEKILAGLICSIFYFSFLIYGFWSYPNISYYKNFYQYALGLKSKQQYFADFNSKANDIYQAANFIVNHTLPEERIFIWGNEPFVYALSRRLPPGRYTVAYHIIDFDGWEETIKAIQEKKVNFIITAPVSGHDFPALEGLLQEKYIKIKKVGECQFYRKISN